MSTTKQASGRTKTGQFPNGVSGNPKGRPPTRKGDELFGMTLDGWANFVTGLGEAKFDKRLQNRMTVCPVSWEEARVIYQGSDMGARLVEARVKEMWRPGFQVSIQDLARAKDVDEDKKKDPNAPLTVRSPFTARFDGKAFSTDSATEDMKSLAKRAQKKFRKLKGKKRFSEAQHYANAYGAGAVLVMVRDGKELVTPLEPERVQSVESMISFEACEFTPIAWYEQLGEKFGEPMIYQLTPKSQSGNAVPLTYVHESRMIVFEGVRIGRNMSTTAQSWLGDSCFTRVKQILSDFDMGFASVGILLQEISIACMKVKGLAEAAANDAGRKKLFARLAAVAMAKSIANMTLIDADGEEFTRTNATVSGVADLLQQLMQRVAAAFDMPVTVLMGMSPAGLNATGASDIRQWYDDIASEREDRLDEPVTNLMGMILRTLNGGIEPGDWCIEWGPLYQMDPKQQADIFLTYANADEKNIMNGLYTADEARKSRFGTSKFCAEITIDTADEDDELDDADVEGYAANDNEAEVDDDEEIDEENPTLTPPTKALDEATCAAIAELIGNATMSRSSRLALLQVGFGFNMETATALLGKEEEDPTQQMPPGGADPNGNPFGGGEDDTEEDDNTDTEEAPPTDDTELNADGYNPDQPRDERGRWGSGGGGSSESRATRAPKEVSSAKIDKAIGKASHAGFKSSVAMGRHVDAKKALTAARKDFRANVKEAKRTAAIAQKNPTAKNVKAAQRAADKAGKSVTKMEKVALKVDKAKASLDKARAAQKVAEKQLKDLRGRAPKDAPKKDPPKKDAPKKDTPAKETPPEAPVSSTQGMAERGPLSEHNAVIATGLQPVKGGTTGAIGGAREGFTDEAQFAIRESVRQGLAEHGIHQTYTNAVYGDVVEVGATDKMGGAAGLAEPNTGRIILDEKYAKHLVEHAKSDPLAVGRAYKQGDEAASGMLYAKHIMNHEQIHQSGPHTTYNDEGVMAEELTTELSARIVTTAQHGMQLHELYGAYEEYITPAVSHLAGVARVPRGTALHALAKASLTHKSKDGRGGNVSGDSVLQSVSRDALINLGIHDSTKHAEAHTRFKQIAASV